ncbi:hypothetical protein [uncultured Roseibium sp.]|uniref:hypothetical protein n=1 Tax=uncultured Roseibium sp. TaxID=1936171 RepID=UPI00260DBA27|nr:hypothetical protein [uncultured Roseibium sp.]
MTGFGGGADPIRQMLKVSTHRSVKQAGGLDAFADITRVGRKTLNDYSNTGNDRHRETFMPVDVLADLILDVKERGEVPPLLIVLCELAGGTFVRVPEPDKTKTAPQLELAALGARHWSFPSLISRYMADEIGSDDFAREALPLVTQLLNDLSQLKQQLLSVDRDLGSASGTAAGIRTRAGE